MNIEILAAKNSDHFRCCSFIDINDYWQNFFQIGIFCQARLMTGINEFHLIWDINNYFLQLAKRSKFRLLFKLKILDSSLLFSFNLTAKTSFDNCFLWKSQFTMLVNFFWKIMF